MKFSPLPGPSTNAITAVVKLAMEWIESTPTKETKVELLTTLRDITEGKIYAEAERAKLTRQLAQIKEADGVVAGPVIEVVKGGLIIDYPYNKDWADKYVGVHFKSCYLEKFIDQDRRNKYLYSASCHTLNDIKVSNKKLFDFIMISPILRPHDNFKAIGWDNFNTLSKESHLPTYALGGVSSKGSDLASCIYNHGFGLAGISSV